MIFLQIETLRTSNNEIVKILFLNPLSKTGNLTVAFNHQMPTITHADKKKSKWGAALVAEKQKTKVLGTRNMIFP